MIPLPINPFETSDDHVSMLLHFLELGSDIEEVPKNRAKSSYR